LRYLQYQRQLILSCSQTLHHQVRIALAELPARGRFDYLKTCFRVRQVLVRLLKQLFQPRVVFREVMLKSVRFRCAEGASPIQTPFNLQEFAF
jgi:hypothetical protein